MITTHSVLNRAAAFSPAAHAAFAPAKAAALFGPQALRALAPEAANVLAKTVSPVGSYRQTGRAAFDFESAIREADRLFQKYSSVLAG
jgi:hypothetical protein